MNVRDVAFSDFGRDLALLFAAAFLAAGAAGAQSAPALILDGSLPTQPQVPVAVPLGFTGGGHAITAIAFSLDLDPAGLAFDATDADLNGVPDAVTLPAGMPEVLVVDYDPDDLDGELDVLLANLSGLPLPEGVIIEFELTSSQNGIGATWIGFSSNPPPSFSNDQGQDVEGTAIVLGHELIFADGFEGGDTASWASTTTP